MAATAARSFSALQRAEIAEIDAAQHTADAAEHVSVLFNEPKLLKSGELPDTHIVPIGFSALQRAEIAEIVQALGALMEHLKRFSALQRAEIAEIFSTGVTQDTNTVSVLFNEPKLLKSIACCDALAYYCRFSALQRAEIAEIAG